MHIRLPTFNNEAWLLIGMLTVTGCSSPNVNQPVAERTSRLDAIEKPMPAEKSDPPAEPMVTTQDMDELYRKMQDLAEKMSMALQTNKPSPAPVQEKPGQIAPVFMTRAELLDGIMEELNSDIRNRKDAALKVFMLKAALSVFDSRYGLTGEDLAGLNERDRFVLMKYQDMFTQLGENMGSGQDQDYEYLTAAARRLYDNIEVREPLKITNTRLCRKCTYYGIYEEFPEYRFKLHKLPRIIVYAELDNFRSQLEPDGRFLVKQQMAMAIYDAESKTSEAVWQDTPRKLAVYSISELHDFFYANLLELPDEMQPGNYELEVTVTDLISKQKDSSRVPLILLD